MRVNGGEDVGDGSYRSEVIEIEKNIANNDGWNWTMVNNGDQ